MKCVITLEGRCMYAVDTTLQQITEWIKELNWIDTPYTGGWDFEEISISPPSVIEARILRNKRVNRKVIRYVSLEVMEHPTEENKERFRKVEQYIDFECLERMKQTDTLKFVNEAKELCMNKQTDYSI